MDTKQSYNLWAAQYDTNINKTKDLEARCIRESLSSLSFENVLEIGCGTGKNTTWLIKNTKHITAVDLSEEMLTKAKEKIKSTKVDFIQADITTQWNFTDQCYDMICFSLVLEHIQALDHIFYEANKKLNPGGIIYIGELHPFKQYVGTKARFETDNGIHVVKCFNHNISEFIHAAKKVELTITDINEYFDADDANEIPRILSLIFKKNK